METWGFISVGISILKWAGVYYSPMDVTKNSYIPAVQQQWSGRQLHHAARILFCLIFNYIIIIRCICSTSYTLRDSPVLVFCDISRVPSEGKVVSFERKCDEGRQWCATVLSQFLCCCSLIIPHLVTCMHDKQCQPHGKALMISLPSRSERWLHCPNGEHFIYYENDVHCVFDTAGRLISLD